MHIIYINNTNQKYLATLKFLFLTLKVLFQMKQVPQFFLLYTKYKASSVTVTLV